MPRQTALRDGKHRCGNVEANGPVPALKQEPQEASRAAGDIEDSGVRRHSIE
jgi:hypothetical protein